MDTNILIGIAIGILLSAILSFVYRFNFKREARLTLEKKINNLKESEEPMVDFELILKFVFDELLRIPRSDQNSFVGVLLSNFHTGKLNYINRLLSNIKSGYALDRFNYLVSVLQQAILESSLPVSDIIFENKHMSEQRLKLMITRSMIDRLKPILIKKFSTGQNLQANDINLFLSISGAISGTPTKDILGLDYTLNTEQISGSITKLWDELETIMLELDPSYERFEFKQHAVAN